MGNNTNEKLNLNKIRRIELMPENLKGSVKG